MEKHSWTEQELWVVCVCYKEGFPVELALRLTNTEDEVSMKYRYRNCLYLDKGKVENALSHASKKHVEVWNKIQAYYWNKKLLVPDEPDMETIVNYSLLIAMAFISLLIAYVLYTT